MAATPARAVDPVILRMVARLRDRYRPLRIILFGSRASGRPHRGSDVDLLIIKSTRKSPIARWEEVRSLLSPVWKGLYASPSPIVVTPSELEARLRMGDPFLTEIVERGRVLYASKG